MFSSFARTSHRIAIAGTVIGVAGSLWAVYLGAFQRVASLGPDRGSIPYGGNSQLMALHYTADILIALAYLSIAVTLTLLYLRERKKAPLAIIFAAFGLLLIASGTTYVGDVLVAWLPLYWLAGDLKLLTALGALTIAVVLPDILPRVHRLIRDALLARKNEQRFLAASNSSRDAFFILESVRNAAGEIVDFRFAFVNTPGAALVSSTPEQLVGQLLCDSYPVNRREGFFDRYKRVVETGQSLHRVFPIDDQQINATWLSHQVVKLEDGVAITTTDISTFKENEHRLLHLAQHDVLTGLATRNLFEERLAAAVNWASQRNQQMKPSAVGLLVVDCDNFKRLNDLLGHQAGDALLTQFAARLKRAVGPADTVARVGGDEFMVVLADLQNAHEAARVAQRILVALQDPMDAEGHSVQMTASIGVCVYPQDVDCASAEGEEEHPGSACAATLLKNADAAMYRAKTEGRNRVQIFTRDMASSLNRRRLLDSALQQALAGQEFELAYQPRVDLATGRVSGVEALLRWKSVLHGSISPYEFIPIAEENGLILPMGQWVLEQACLEMQELSLTIGRVMPLAVNVSPRQFQQESLASDIFDLLQRFQLAPGSLEVEITENLLLEESPRSRANLEALQGMGVSIAIDDFGTGYSSMSYLTRFQADRLKIDQSFVRRMSQDGESEAICKAIVGLGKALSMTVVAEGVETGRCRDMLRSLGCDEVQGYLYARPMPLAELSAALHLIEFDALSSAAA